MQATHTIKRYALHKRRVYARRYPNAADCRYFWNRLADGILCAASCIGIVAVLIFIFTI